MANLAALARPLTALTRKDRTTGSTVQFKWDRQCEEVFKTLEERLTTAPILRPLNLSKELFVWTDASQGGFGAVL